MDTKENFSYLDGVPFVIGPKFCPPQNVTLPIAVNYELSSELLSQTYDFDVENKVVKDSLEAIESQNLESNSNNENSEIPTNSSVQKTLAHRGSLCWPSDCILQPQSQTQNKNLEDSSSLVSQNAKKINLSEFENDMTSPFDYMELQTINDLEELNTVFQGLCENRQESTMPNSNLESNGPNSSTHYPHTVQSENQPSNVSKSVSFPLSQNFNESNLENNVNNTLTDKPNENYFSYSSPNTPGIATGSASLPFQGDDLKQNSFHGGESKFTSLALPPVPSFQANQNFGYGYSSGYTSFENNIPLRSSKSIPDLSNLDPEEETHCKTLRSHTPPAKSFGYTPNALNHKTFVRNEACASNTATSNCVASNGLPTKSMKLPDPYEELNNSEKETVDSIYDMGFDRGQVSRTVKHLGTDSKKVIEHLCQIQVLEESGYDKLEAEAALHLHDYNKNEAIKYLDLLIQFQDLGFEKDAIKKALVQNKNDRDKVIDMLLSS